jgi:hypothetical protein
MAWFASIAASTAAIGLATGSIMLVLGHRFIEEFTRPGITIDQETSGWRGPGVRRTIGTVPREQEMASAREEFFKGDTCQGRPVVRCPSVPPNNSVRHDSR